MWCCAACVHGSVWETIRTALTCWRSDDSRNPNRLPFAPTPSVVVYLTALGWLTNTEEAVMLQARHRE